MRRTHGVVGVQGLHLFTVYYLAGRAERAASLYGAIGAALTLLLWLYIVARLMVGGAILNATLAGEHDRSRRRPDTDDGRAVRPEESHGDPRRIDLSRAWGHGWVRSIRMVPAR